MAGKPDRIINIHGHIRHHDDLPARVKLWRQWNVEKFVCLCMNRPSRFNNEDFLAAKKEYGDLLVGFAATKVTAAEGIDGSADIKRYAEQGFAGLKIIRPGFPINHEAYFPIYETAQSLGTAILFHTGWLANIPEADIPLGVDANNMRPYYFDRIARAFPDLKIIGAHLGLPHSHEALQMLEVYKNVYFDISGGSGRKPHVRKILNAMLPHPSLETDMADPTENLALGWFEKLCFGTDNPEPDVWVPAAEFILDRLEIPEETRRKFYYGNAAKLLGL